MAINDIATGHGATVVFGTSSYTLAVTSITPPPWEIPVLDKSTLATTSFREKIPGDLVEPGQMTIEILFKRNNYITPGGTPETVTLTWPNESVTAASLAGTAFVASFTPGALVTDELQAGSLVVQYDGGTGPAFTAEAAV